ncbi:MAG: YkgJ family cysteine cluster protein [Promethearchaeota archaeon]
MFELLDEVKNGFKFKCQQCGRCCKGVDDGFVFLYDEEIDEIVEFLNIDIDEFMGKYGEVIDTEFKVSDNEFKPKKKKIFLKTIVLKQDEKDGSCIFLDTQNSKNLCKIYKIRPSQCKNWPVWYLNMTQTQHYKNAVEKCPGFNAENGEFYSRAKIIKILKNEINVEQDFIKRKKKS